MTYIEKAPAAWQGHAGHDACSDPSLVPHALIVETLRRVARDVYALYRAGQWSWAREQCQAALNEHRQRVRQRAIGAEILVDQIAGDLAQLVGLDGGLVEAVARDTLLETPLTAVARELAVCRAELPRDPEQGARP